MSMPAIPLPLMTDCEWARPEYRVAGEEEPPPFATAAICIRQRPRKVSQEVCGVCTHWEKRSDHAAA